MLGEPSYLTEICISGFSLLKHKAIHCSSTWKPSASLPSKGSFSWIGEGDSGQGLCLSLCRTVMGGRVESK